MTTRHGPGPFRRLALLGLTALVTSHAGCSGSARRDEPLVGPLRLDSPDLVQGQRQFMAHCHKCHPGGDAGLGPALNDKPAPAALVRFQVRRGLGAMPAFASDVISDPELESLVAYVIALRQHGR